jgi:hypothetical protein
LTKPVLFSALIVCMTKHFGHVATEALSLEAAADRKKQEISGLSGAKVLLVFDTAYKRPETANHQLFRRV